MNSNSLPYRIRNNPRARHVQIKVEHNGDVVVVLPRVFRNLNVPELIEKHRAWILKTRAKYLAHREHDAALGMSVPEHVELTLLQARWKVNHVTCLEGQRARFVVKDDEIDLKCTTVEEAHLLLQRWIHKRAKETLAPWIQQLAAEYGFDVNRVFIKAQKTRWGSCSSERNINLNRNILFLNTEQARYLLIHELCHLRHMNHSAAYWRQVARYAPNYRAIEASLNISQKSIPLWALS